MTYVVTEPCVDVKDKTCVAECPVDCIYEGERQMYINPIECIDCGACEPVCPVDAIFFDYDLKEVGDDFLVINRDVFGDNPNPGGARALGPLGRDHPVVAALPPKLAS